MALWLPEPGSSHPAHCTELWSDSEYLQRFLCYHHTKWFLLAVPLIHAGQTCWMLCPPIAGRYPHTGMLLKVSVVAGFGLGYVLESLLQNHVLSRSTPFFLSSNHYLPIHKDFRNYSRSRLSFLLVLVVVCVQKGLEISWNVYFIHELYQSCSFLLWCAD